jgi:hypothetical protein
MGVRTGACCEWADGGISLSVEGTRVLFRKGKSKCAGGQRYKGKS